MLPACSGSCSSLSVPPGVTAMPAPPVSYLSYLSSPRLHASATVWSLRQCPSSQRTFLHDMTVGFSSRSGERQEIPVAHCARLFGHTAPSLAKLVREAGDRDGVHVQLTLTQSPDTPPFPSRRPLRGTPWHMRSGRSQEESVPNNARARQVHQCKGWPGLRRGCMVSWGGGQSS